MGLVKRAKPAAEQVAIEARSSTQLLLELEASAPEVRRAAARELSGVAEVAAALVAAFSREPERSVREVIGTTLVSTADPSAPALLVPLLHSEDATLRNDARDLLLLLPGAEQVAGTLVGHADDSVRMFATEVLVARVGKHAADTLAALLEEEDDINVCAHLAEKLAEIGGVRHIDAMQSVLERLGGDDFLAFVIKGATEAILERSPHVPFRGQP